MNDNTIVYDAVKEFFQENEVFLDLFNAYYFKGRAFFDPLKLETIELDIEKEIHHYMVKKTPDMIFVLHFLNDINYPYPVTDILTERAIAEYLQDWDTPILSLVLYLGKESWNDWSCPRSLHSMINIEDDLKEHFQYDYMMHLIDFMNTERNLPFKNTKIKELQRALMSFYYPEKCDSEYKLDKDVLNLAQMIVRK